MTERILLLLSLLAFASCKPSNPTPSSTRSFGSNTTTEVVDVTVDQGETLLKEGKAKVLDVRTPAEFDMERIDGALNADFNSANFLAELDKLDKKTPYLLHCRSGNRSTKALEKIEEKGFQKIYHLKAGLNGWKEAGKPTIPKITP